MPFTNVTVSTIEDKYLHMVSDQGSSYLLKRREKFFACKADMTIGPSYRHGDRFMLKESQDIQPCLHLMQSDFVILSK